MEAHGGNIYEYQENGDIIDFSSNINPFGVPDSFKKKIEKAISNLEKYPDINYCALRKNLEMYTKIPKDWIFPGNGAVDIIYKAIKASGAEKIIIAGPTFAEYRRGARIAGIEYEELFLHRLETGSFNIEKTMEALNQEKSKKLLLIICNPNNPNGGQTSVPEFEILAEKLEAQGGRLLIDEAFIEFTDGYPASSFMGKIEKHRNTMLVRAMTKFFGMPGIRFGYGLTYDQEWLRKMKDSCEPWTVNTFAELAAETVLQDEEYIKKTKEWIVVERDYLTKELKRIEGVEVFPTYSDFVLCRLDREIAGVDENKFYDKLILNKILIRKSIGFTGLGAEYFRLAIKDRETNELLLKAISKVLITSKDNEVQD